MAELSDLIKLSLELKVLSLDWIDEAPGSFTRPFLISTPQHSVDNQAFSSLLCKHRECLLLTWKPY